MFQWTSLLDWTLRCWWFILFRNGRCYHWSSSVVWFVRCTQSVYRSLSGFTKVRETTTATIVNSSIVISFAMSVLVFLITIFKQGQRKYEVKFLRPFSSDLVHLLWSFLIWSLVIWKSYAINFYNHGCNHVADRNSVFARDWESKGKSKIAHSSA